MNTASLPKYIRLSGFALLTSVALTGCFGGSDSDDQKLVVEDPSNTLPDDSSNTPPDNSSDTPPTLTLSGESVTKIKLGELSYDEANIRALVQALDAEDGDLSGSVIVSGDLIDINTAGAYNLTLSVKDSDGNTAELNHTVRVADYGAMDTTFDTDGSWISSSDDYSKGRDIVTDANGNSYVAGILDGEGADLKVWKINPEGLANDSSFGGSDGLTIPMPNATDEIDIDSSLKIKLDASGKLLIAGTLMVEVVETGAIEFIPHIWRLNTNGSMDHNFTLNELKLVGEDTILEAFDVDRDGNLYFSGYINDGLENRIFIAKYSAEGVIDTSFGTDGSIIIGKDNDSDEMESGLAITESGDILLAGRVDLEDGTVELKVLKFDSNGKHDTSFADNGEFTYANNFSNASMQAIALDNQENILLLGGVATSPLDSEVIVLKLDTQGQLVESFANNGKIKLNSDTEPFFGKALTIDPENNAMLIAGFDLMDPKAQVRAYDSQGNPARYFGENGVASSDNTLPNPGDSLGLWLDTQTNRLYVTGTTGNTKMFLMKLIN